MNPHSPWILIVAVTAACDVDPIVASSTPSLTSPELNLSSSSAASVLAYNFGWNVAVDGRGQVHVVWTEGNAVAYRRSADNGVTWTPNPAALFGSNPGVGGPRVAASGDNIYIAWHGVYEGYSRIYLIHSTDAGATFQGPQAISDPGIAAAYPTIAAAGSAVHVVWSDNRAKLVGGVADTHAEIYIRSSTNAGASFATTHPVSVADHHSSWTPSVAASASAVHVVWTDEKYDTVDCADRNDSANCHEEELYARSLDGGVTWSTEARLTHDTGAPASSWAPSVAVAGSTVHVAYFDFRTGVPRIYYQRSIDAGVTWPAAGEQLISNPADPLPSARPVLSAIGSEVRMVYWRGPDATGAADVYVTTSSAAGAAGTWATPAPLTANIGHAAVSALQPSIALAPTGASHVIWMDDRAGAANTDIYYRRL